MSDRDQAAWLSGPRGVCRTVPEVSGRPYRLVLLGPPGVGKGTQAELISRALGACHLSTGDVFRVAKSDEASQRSPAIEEALDHMSGGHLVPDDTVIALVRERIGCLRCGGGFLLDGFPRTVDQAEALGKLLASAGLELDGALSFELPRERVVARASGRRTCSRCRLVFHLDARPPRTEGTCDNCGGDLVLREDDRPESVQARMDAYERTAASLADYYRRRDQLWTISANGTPEEVFGRTLSRIHEAWPIDASSQER